MFVISIGGYGRRIDSVNCHIAGRIAGLCIGRAIMTADRFQNNLIGQTVTESWAMRRAVDLGLRSFGRTWPNPSVGCVIVAANGTLVSFGRHEVCGGPHAEIQALRAAETNFGSAVDDVLAGATAYVTLSPCTTFGRTPPCSDALRRAGVGRVVAGVEDLNQDDAGPFFRKNGIQYDVASLGSWFGAACNDLHGGFASRIHLGRPRMTVKWAQTNDGFIAQPGGGGAISCPVARRASRRHRRRFDAMLVGAKTVRIDDPALRAVPAALSPQAVVVTRSGFLPNDAALLAHQPWVICEQKTELSPDWQACRVLRLADLSAVEIARCLAQQGCNDVLIEGGSDIQRQFFDADLVDLLHIEIGPQTWGAGLRAPRDIAGIEAIFRAFGILSIWRDAY